MKFWNGAGQNGKTCISQARCFKCRSKFSVHRLCDKEGKHNLANRFVGELMEQLVQDGLLVTTKTRNGLGVRTATDAEISSPLPGQQQMTL